MIELNNLTGVNTFNIEQGTNEWLHHRVGVITASRAHDIIKKGRSKGSYSEMRKAYMNELIGQVCTGETSSAPNFKQAEWGHMNEELARDSFEAMNMCIVTQCGLVYKDDSLRCAISPDGLLMSEKEGLEIKSPWTTKVHIDFLLDGKIKPEYFTQVQYSMWVTGFTKWHFCSYDNRMKGEAKNRLAYVTIEPDEEMFKTLDKEIPLFIEEMDEKLKSLNFAFGDQWK